MWFVFQNSIHPIFQQQLPIFILSFTLSSFSSHFSPCPWQDYTSVIPQRWNMFPRPQVLIASHFLSSGDWLRDERETQVSNSEFLGKPTCSCLLVLNLKGWNDWNTAVGNLILKPRRKQEIMDEEQLSSSELFSLNPAVLEAWNLRLGFSVTRKNTFPFNPVWVRFSATCNWKNPTYSLESSPGLTASYFYALVERECIFLSCCS